MATNLPSCFSIQFLEQLLKFLANFTLLKYVKSQKLWLFNHKRANFWLPNFGFKRSLLSLLNFAPCLATLKTQAQSSIKYSESLCSVLYLIQQVRDSSFPSFPFVLPDFKAKPLTLRAPGEGSKTIFARRMISKRNFG